MTNGVDPTARRYASKQVKGDYANPFAEDLDSIFYSTACRRLAGVTQVAPATEQRLLHNRLTHSLKVSQVGRRLADRVLNDPDDGNPDLGKYIDPVVVETAGLAHDLGHPPFGHAAETVLDELMSAVDGLEGFEGNAQTFRIVTKLSARETGSEGLNLTRGSLDAILKYPRKRKEVPQRGVKTGREWTDREYGNKWGYYESEAKIFGWVRSPSGEERDASRCAAAILVDWADDVSYAIHDVEDYFRAGLIPLHQIEDDFGRIVAHGVARLTKSLNEGFNEGKFQSALRDVVDSLPFKHPFSDTSRDREILYEVTSTRLRDYVSGAVAQDDFPYVRIKERQQYEVEALKELTWFYVIHNPALALVQEGQKKVVTELYKTLRDWLCREEQSPRIPHALFDFYEAARRDLQAGWQGNRNAMVNRAVCDYLCTLTDAQALDIYERLIGMSRGSVFGVSFV
ncbi:dGTP triphosphohydrolase [Streptomyces sp. NPDC005820]|uniref:deoxyguanosinetriphosphate triphosphohydrolase family protein n=1 Tax=Streptomyces sp. NPDC005820 TaxID=3157069 RepID=UPI0033EBA9EF